MGCELGRRDVERGAGYGGLHEVFAEDLSQVSEAREEQAASFGPLGPHLVEERAQHLTGARVAEGFCDRLREHWARKVVLATTPPGTRAATVTRSGASSSGSDASWYTPRVSCLMTPDSRRVASRGPTPKRREQE
jgi:hypothetical protein